MTSYCWWRDFPKPGVIDEDYRLFGCEVPTPNQNPFLGAFVAASLERARLVLASCPHPEHWHDLSRSAFEDRSVRDLGDDTHGCGKTCTPEAVEQLNHWKRTLSRLVSPQKPDILPMIADGDTPSTFFFRAQDLGKWLLFFESHDTPRRCREEVANLTIILLLKRNALECNRLRLKGTEAERRMKEITWTEEAEELFQRLLLEPVHKCQEYQYVTVPASNLNGLLCDVIHLGYRALDFLVRSGADVNAKLIRSLNDHIHLFGSPLISAVVRDFESGMPCVEYLLNNGADANGQVFEVQYGTPLIAACANGRMDALRLLLQQPDLDVNMATQFSKYGTALIAACLEAKIAALHLLLQQPNLDVNMATQFTKYGIALIAACAHATRPTLEYGDSSATVVKYLLGKGAHANQSVTMTNGNYRTALAAAIDNRIPRIVQILLKSGAIANERVKAHMPSDSEAANYRWGCFRSKASVPYKGPAYADDEWIDQCILAARQLSVVIIYALLKVDVTWADEYIRQALYCLRVFSSTGKHDYRAAEITLRELGFDGKDYDRQMLPSLRAELRESDAGEERGGWSGVVDCLITLITKFEEAAIPIPRRTRGDDSDDDMLLFWHNSDEEIDFDSCHDGVQDDDD